MAETPYITIRLGAESLDLPQTADLPIALTYEIEDEDDFRQKKAGTALNITVPATTKNSEKLNTLFNPGAEDLLPNEGFDKPQDVVIIGAGNELMKGKAFVLTGRKQFGQPLNFDIDIFGDNADWVIPNKELTLHDVVSSVTHNFDKSTIEASWLHDGTVESEDYVYAPFRGRRAFASNDSNFLPTSARPSLFLYWLLYRGFKKAGYKIDSAFFDSDYFRRMVLPWTWGTLVYNEDTINATKFKALQIGEVLEDFSSTTGQVRADWNWMTSPLPAFDNGNNISQGGTPLFFLNFSPTLLPNGIIHNYFFSLTFQMSWQIPMWAPIGPPNGFVSTVTVLKNGSTIQTLILAAEQSQYLSNNNNGGQRQVTFYACCSNTDTISIILDTQITSGGTSVTVQYTGGEYYNIPTNICYGSIVDFKRFEAFKNYKWLDLLRGTIDYFNLQINTDNVTKTVTLEPTHDYSLDNDLGNKTGVGYYNGNVLEWTQKEDISQVSEVKIYQDFEKEFVIKAKEDGNDGILKLTSDRKKIDITSSKYIFPDRFKKGIKEMENRFFSGVMHYEHTAWKDITGISPQLICLIPENIANTSNPESESTFQPKLAWYKGVVDRAVYGGWNWDGDDSLDLPFMFAVNYKPGGENDPVVTYCDQNIDGVVAKGFLKRYFWQRLAIMRHGKQLHSYFMLNTTDVLNRLHREYKVVGNQRYQLIKIESYKPLLNESTKSVMWLWYPVTQEDNDNTFPSNTSVLTGNPTANPLDIKYSPFLCLPSDIPQ